MENTINPMIIGMDTDVKRTIIEEVERERGIVIVDCMNNQNQIKTNDINPLEFIYHNKSYTENNRFVDPDPYTDLLSILPNNISIEREYELIKNKKSKLSKRERDAVINIKNLRDEN